MSDQDEEEYPEFLMICADEFGNITEDVHGMYQKINYKNRDRPTYLNMTFKNDSFVWILHFTGAYWRLDLRPLKTWQSAIKEKCCMSRYSRRWPRAGIAWNRWIFYYSDNNFRNTLNAKVYNIFLTPCESTNLKPAKSK